MNPSDQRKKIIKWLIRIVPFLTLFVLLFIFRYSIARCLSSFLIVDYTHDPSEVIFVLSGNAYDRGKFAAKLSSEGISKRIICTGGNKDANALVLGKDLYECELTLLAITKFNTDSSLILDTLCRGTSTLEECRHIQKRCDEMNWKHITIVSSAFHTRRIRMTCNKVFQEDSIRIDIAPAPPRYYKVDSWWSSEYGLIDLNNEYVKLIYYLIK
jgi:uncharacterized SAM-binding protein YcdF (DUF218 family)